MTNPIRVSVLVDLARGVEAGGHVKVWERLARVAAEGPYDDLDLTVHFVGPRERTLPLSDRVRLVEHPPVLSTDRLRFLPPLPAHTDLSPFHPGLARHLARCDVIHTTDAYFAFGHTGARVARMRGLPLVTSVHTDTPGFTRLYVAATIERVLGRGRAARLVIRHGRPGDLVAAFMSRQLLAHQRACACTWVSRPEMAAALTRRAPGARVRVLRRGVDRGVFHPGAGDRRSLERALGIPRGRELVLFAGRLDRTKNVRLLAEAVRDLIGEGCPIHLLCAGEGPDRAAVTALLGPHVTCAGVLSEAELARAYASADLFVQPGELDETSNVVREALASGVPVIAAPRAGAHLLEGTDAGAVVTGGSREAWAAALRELVRDPERRAAMARAARLLADRAIPTWTNVLEEDLLPGWRLAAGRPARHDPALSERASSRKAE